MSTREARRIAWDLNGDVYLLSETQLVEFEQLMAMRHDWDPKSFYQTELAKYAAYKIDIDRLKILEWELD